jgi:hypothetical protein
VTLHSPGYDVIILEGVKCEVICRYGQKFSVVLFFSMNSGTIFNAA